MLYILSFYGEQGWLLVAFEHGILYGCMYYCVEQKK